MNQSTKRRSDLDWRGRLNSFLRKQATWLKPQNPIRRTMQKAWTWALSASGNHVPLNLHGYSVRLQNRFRSFPVDYERETLEAFLARIHPGDVIWDVGGNLGIYTLLAGMKVGHAGQVVTWDANPHCYKAIVDHVRANGLDGVCKVLHCAISDGTVGRVQFWIDRPDNHSPSSRIKQDGRPIDMGEVMEVEAKSMDHWFEQLQRRPNLIKVDVEGAEVLALRGATKLLNDRSQPRPQFLLAVHPHMMKEFGTDISEFLSILSEAEYVTFDPAGRPVAAAEYSEYFAIPKERLDELCPKPEAAVGPAK